jgi:hypothetical protein
MKKIIFSFFSIFIIPFSISGQVNIDSLPPPDTLPLYVKPYFEPFVRGGSIRYFFPLKVDSLIRRFVAAHDCKQYFMRYKHNCNGVNNIVLYRENCNMKSDTTDILNILLSISNRFYKVDSIIIPIYFESDFECASETGVVFTGCDLCIEFKGSYPLDGEIIKLEGEITK